MQGKGLKSRYSLTFDRCINSFPSKVSSRKPQIPTAERKQLFLVLPYTGTHGLLMGKNSGVLYITPILWLV